METMHIKTGNGSMTINVCNFFPCGARQFQKLFKILMEFSYLNNVQEISEQLAVHFREQIGELEARQKKCSANYLASRQQYVDYNYIVESGKHPNGIGLRKEELKEFKEKRRMAKSRAAGFENDFKRYGKQLEAYKKNLNALEQVG